jgi:hypothetical protein
MLSIAKYYHSKEYFANKNATDNQVSRVLEAIDRIGDFI